jgi:hypothetical protein
MESVIFGENQYCGPAALSTITGKNTDEVSKIMYRFGYRDKEMQIECLKRTLDFLEFDWLEETRFEDMNMISFFMLAVREDATYLVVVPKHIVAIQVKEHKIFICDNHTKTPMNAQGSARLGQRVLKVYRVTERPFPAYNIERCMFDIKELLKRYNGSLMREYINNYLGRDAALISEAIVQLTFQDEIGFINRDLGSHQTREVFLKSHMKVWVE